MVKSFFVQDTHGTAATESVESNGRAAANVVFSERSWNRRLAWARRYGTADAVPLSGDRRWWKRTVPALLLFHRHRRGRAVGGGIRPTMMVNARVFLHSARARFCKALGEKKLWWSLFFFFFSECWYFSKTKIFYTNRNEKIVRIFLRPTSRLRPNFKGGFWRCPTPLWSSRRANVTTYSRHVWYLLINFSFFLIIRLFCALNYHSGL